MLEAEQAAINGTHTTLVIRITAKLRLAIGDEEPIRAKPLVLAILEACSGQTLGISKQNRSRARLDHAEKVARIGITPDEGEPFRWTAAPPIVYFDGGVLTPAAASSLLRKLLNAGHLDENLAFDVLDDLESWKSIFDHLSYLEADSPLREVSDATTSPCPETQAVQLLLRWWIGYWQAMGDAPSEKLPKLGDIAMKLKKSRIQQSTEYVAELARLLENRRKMLMLASRNETLSDPTGVSPTLCSHASELQGFENVRQVRAKLQKHKTNGAREDIETAALASINQFARALLFGAISHRLGRVLDCAAHLVGTYAELAEKGVLNGARGKKLGIDRFQLSMQWLLELLRCSSTTNSAKHKALIQDIAIVTLRRYATYRARVMKLSEINHEKVDGVNRYADELWNTLLPSMNNLSRWGTVVEAWRAAAELKKPAGKLPNPFVVREAQLNASKPDKLRQRLFETAERGDDALRRILIKRAGECPTPLALDVQAFVTDRFSPQLR